MERCTRQTDSRFPYLIPLLCHHACAFLLCYSQGSKTPVSLKADTSGAIVLNAVMSTSFRLPRQVSCNHFDTDGASSAAPACAALKHRSRKHMLKQSRGVFVF